MDDSDDSEYQLVPGLPIDVPENIGEGNGEDEDVQAVETGDSGAQEETDLAAPQEEPEGDDDHVQQHDTDLDESVATEEESHRSERRSKRVSKPPCHLSDYHCYNVNQSDDWKDKVLVSQQLMASTDRKYEDVFIQLIANIMNK